MADVGAPARTLPGSIAKIVQQLELIRPVVVTLSMLTEIAERISSHLTASTAAERLVREGWLIPLRTRGAWEFAPGENTDRISLGDEFIELRALLAKHPEAPVAVAFKSAVWLSGFSMHPHTYPTFAYRPGWRPPRSLNHLTAYRYEWHLPVVKRSGLPIWRPATIVVAAAAHPSRQRDWSNADTWLPGVLEATTDEEVFAEAEGRSTAALIRLGYLAEWAGYRSIAEKVKSLLPANLPVTYLGPRDIRGRWVKQWKLYDSVLPTNAF